LEFRDVAAKLAQPTPPVVRVNPKVDLYDSEEKEILLFDDGIQVKEPKAKRQSPSKQ